MISPLGHAELYRTLKERGIEPLFGDVDPDSMTLTAEEAQRGVEQGAKAIFVDEALGYVPDLEGIAASGVPLIEDVSESLGGHDGKRKCGEYGSFIVQRLEEDDIITGGGGTLLCASGRQWSSGLKSHAERLDPGARLSDLNAALASIQLKELENYVSRRQEVYAYLLDALRKSRHHAPVQKGEGEHMPYAFPVYIDGSLKEAQSYARKKGVETRQAFAHCALSSLDAEDEWNGEARKIAMRTLLFPIYPRLSKKEVETIGKVIATLP
jgi:dTDP-4-amino-4,6-dideoxygalactose transaminase